MSSHYLAWLLLCSLGLSRAQDPPSDEFDHIDSESDPYASSEEIEDSGGTTMKPWDPDRSVAVCSADKHHKDMVIWGEWEGLNEDTLKVVERMGNELHIANPLHDVFQAYRGKVPKSTNCKPIVVHMISQKARDKWIDAYNHKDNWRIFEHEDWYVTGRLRKVNFTKLEPALHKWAEKNKYKAHIDGIHVYYRKNATSGVFRVTDLEHLGYLMNKTIEHKWEIPVNTHEGKEQQKYMKSILKHFSTRSKASKKMKKT